MAKSGKKKITLKTNPSKGTNRRGKGGITLNNSKATRVQINDNMQFAQRAQKDKGIL
jgi:hypothetical protein